MSAAGFRGRGGPPLRGRKLRGLPSGLMGARNPQPNFNQPRRGMDSHGPPTEFWLDHPPSVPWQQMNGLPPPQGQHFSGFEPHRYRGRPQFCPGIGARGRSKRIRGEGRPRPGILPPPGFGGMGLARPETEPARFPPLGSEEERQQKIAETADKLKQKLSSLTIEEPVNFWEDDISGVSFSNDEDLQHLIANRGIPELRHDPPELNLTGNDFKDIGRVDPDNSLNFEECVEVVPVEENKAEDPGAQEDEEGPEIWLEEDVRNHENCDDEGNEPLNSAQNIDDDDANPRSTETAKETTTGENWATNSSRNDIQSGEVDQPVVEQPSLLVEKEPIKKVEKRPTDMKPELTKPLEKLREVIKGDRELEKDERPIHPDNRTIFQPNTGPRLQPDVRLDFRPPLGPPYPRFQGFNHMGGPHEMRSRFRGPYRPDHGVEMQQNFDYQPRFEPGSRNFNRPPGPRMMHGDFVQQRMSNRNPDLQRGFYPREPPHMFNGPPRQEPPWFGRNDLPHDFSHNGLHPPRGFDLRGPPPRFMNQDQDPPMFGPNVGPNPQIMPIGYPPVQHMHMGHQTGYFNPAMPPPNTAPCIINKFISPAAPQTSNVESQALQPPPMPMGALEMQSHILRQPPSPPPSPPDLPPAISSQNPTPNMNEELEDMQEALEFAKKLMNMTEEEEEEEETKEEEEEQQQQQQQQHEAEEETPQTFDMPIFPDLPPIPSTEPSHLAEIPEPEIVAEVDEPKDAESEATKEGPAPQIPFDDSAENADAKSIEIDDLLEAHIRPRVAFNLSSRTKRIAKVDEWQSQNDEGSSKQKKPQTKTAESQVLKQPQPEDKCDGKLKENRNSRKSRAQLREEDKPRESKEPKTPVDGLGQKENRVKNIAEIGTKAVDDIAKPKASGSKTGAKSATVDANWKDKVINRFLKMSKNDICNMVNSSGLRKFDIAMKHLVKERKYSLSQERRCNADDAVKGAYDMSREEFMSQLSAMLDPSATVDVKNLPSKFIQHLSEVLKLDVQSHLNDATDQGETDVVVNSVENAEQIVEVNNFVAICEPEELVDPLGETNIVANYSAEDNLVEKVKIETEVDQETQMTVDFSHPFPDVAETLPDMDVIDGIFAEGIARAKQSQKSIVHKENAEDSMREIEGEFITHGLIRARCTKTLMSEENADLDEIFSAGLKRAKQTALKNIEIEAAVVSEEICQPKVNESAEVWGRKKRQDPDMFRNLTKEEWEARCAKESVNEKNSNPSSRDTSISARSRSPRSVDKTLKTQQSSRNLSPPSPLRDKNYSLNIQVHTSNEAVDKWTKATEEELIEGDSEGGSSCSSVSSNSEQPPSTNVSKLLKVIKEREKIAKDMSINETIRDEVAAEMERAKGRDESERKIRKREKSKRKKERREKRKIRRKKKTGLETAEAVPVSHAKEIVEQQTFIKQEELIIEADNEPLNTGNSPATKKPDSHSTAERNEETLSEFMFQDLDEALPHSEGALKSQEMLVAQEYAECSNTTGLKADFSSHDADQPANSDGEKLDKDPEMEPTPAENLPVKFEPKETRTAAEIQLSKSGAKKIDIQAYKARKLQRNTKKVDKFKESKAHREPVTVEAINVLGSSQEAKETPKASKSEDFKTQGKEANTAEDSEPGSKKIVQPLLDGQDSLAQPLHKEKSAVPKVKSEKRMEKREERKQDKDTSAKSDKKSEKGNSDEKFDKKRSRNHSRDKERSSSREDSRRTGKDKSKHSSQEKKIDKSQAKVAQQNNNIVDIRDRKTTKHKACNSPREIEKHQSKSKKNSAEERTGDSGFVSQEVVIDKEKEQIEDLKNVENRDLQKEAKDVQQKYVEILTTVTETEENIQETATEFNVSDQTGESTHNDMQTSDEACPLLSAEVENEPTSELASETADLENELRVENAEEDTGKQCNSKEDDRVDNEMTDPSAAEEEILKLNDSKDPENESANEFHQNEAVAELDSLESMEKGLSNEPEVSSEFELKQSCENEIKNILNDLIDKAISQLDLLNSKNEAKETILREAIEEEENVGIFEPAMMATEIEPNSAVLPEYTTPDLNSPATPESPLKGFSEETIKSSLLGKRRLAQSVADITEDYMLNKRPKVFDEATLNVTTESVDSRPNDHQEPVADQNLKEIVAGSGKTKIETAHVIGKESEPKEAQEIGEIYTRCATPSGDTLSLGSSIDFDHSEFVAPSEISSDEEFSQDEDRKTRVRANQELERVPKLNNEEMESGKKTEENDATEKGLPDIENPSKSNASKPKKKHLKLKTDGKNSATVLQDEAKPSASKHFSQLSELEFSLIKVDGKPQTGDTAANVIGEFQRETIEEPEPLLPSEETESLSKLVENKALLLPLACELSLKKPSAIADDDGRRKISDCKKLPKSSTTKSKDASSSENSVNKNLHRVRHKHRMKHKKDKKCKVSEKHIKDTVREGELVTVVKKQQTKEGVMARMVEIDLEIHKLMSEKMKLYQMLENGELPNEQSLVAAKNGPEPLIQVVNTPRREPDLQPTSNETGTPSAKQKSSGSKAATEPLHSKSSKTPASCASEDDRHGGNHRDTIIKKSKKSHRHERESRPHSQTESQKSSTAKSSVTKRKNTEDKSTSKKTSHSRSSSSSNRRKEKEEETSHGKRYTGLVKETADEEAAAVCQKSKKADHHSGQKKKTTKVSDSKEEPCRRVKKEAQPSSVNDELELRSGTVCESENILQEKNPPQIYSDESSQVSLAQDYKTNKNAPKGLALLEETYKRERAVARKRRAAICKRKKKPMSLLSPLEQEMPLDLLYVKKFLRKRAPVNNVKIKRTTSTEVLEHVLEAINAVAENKIEEYQRSSKMKSEGEAVADINGLNTSRKAKALGKSKSSTDNGRNPTHATIDESQALWPLEHVRGKNLTGNFSDNDFRDLDDRVNGSKSTTSLQESDDKFPVDKIMEISRENNGDEIGKNKSRTKSVGSRGEVEQLSLFGNIFGDEVNDITEGDSGRGSCRRWIGEDVHTFNYLNDIPQFDDSDSTFMPPEQSPHSNSISHNVKDIEKELDVLDSMLETVGSDLEGISSKDVSPSSVKKGKRKRMGSGESAAHSEAPSRKRNAVARSDIKNCSVRLVDCKYTYLKNCLNSGAGQKFTIFSPETDKQNDPLLAKATLENATESHALMADLEDPVLRQETHQLIDRDENSPLISGNYLTAETDISLNHLEENSEYDEDDLEIMRLNPSNFGTEDLVEARNWQSLNELHANRFLDSECATERSEMLGSERTDSPLLLSCTPTRGVSVSEQTAELGIDAEPFSKLIDLDVGQEDNVEILPSETRDRGEEEEAAAEYRVDIEVINPLGEQATDEIEEVELPRIQYSVHKGPILDVKVFGDSILAASEDGVIYRYSQTCNGILNTYEGHKSAVTCIYVLQGTGASSDWLFSGSLDGSLRCFDITTSHQVRGAADVSSPVQCMDQSWGTIFLGTKSGHVSQFDIKSHAFKGEKVKFSEDSVLALKATTEGPRKVLIVASRSQPIQIRDATTGLFLRTVSGHKSHTVYSLMMDSNLIYCGTSSTAIPVFDFINGSEVRLYNAGPGIVCMRMYKWLLFAGCYDGNIYVFDTKEQKLVCSIPGPGNMLLSMDIVKNKIVAGSKDRRLHIWQMPQQVLSLLAGRT